MNPEPSAQDVAAVQAAIGGQPAPQAPEPQPAPQPTQPEPQPQMQPEAPASQPAPTQQTGDPFASLFASEGQSNEPAPQAPQEQPQEQQPTEVYQQPQEQPQQPAQQSQAQANDDYQSYEDYMKSVLAGVPEAPQSPNPENINPDDPAAIKGFFDDILSTAEKRFEANYARKQAIQNAEKKQWDAAFEKYGSLKTNKELRDMVHNIRMANFQRGIAMTPTQAAQKLLQSLGQQYRQGVADNQVVTTYESVQPNGGGTGAAQPTSLDRDNALTAVQTGGETALADILDQEIKAGRL